MVAKTRSTISRILRGAPTALTLLVLAGVGYLGHRIDWKISSIRSVLGSAEETTDDWCMDHGVPESSCLICRGLAVSSTPPTEQVRLRQLGSAAGASEGKKETQRAEKETSEESEAPALEPSNSENAPERAPVQLSSPEALAGAGIKTAPSTRREMKEFIEANAEVRYDTTRYAQVSTRVPGTVALVRAEVGGKVARGDVMALVDAAEVGRLKAELLQAAAQVEVRTKSLERSRVSVEKRFGTEAELQEADAELKESRIRLFNARQALINLGLPAPDIEAGSLPSERELQLLGLPESIAHELDPARTTANLIPIIAPLDGIVVSRSVVPGEVVEAAKPLFAVANTERMWVVADVSVNEIPRLHLGQELTFLADGWGEPCTGPIAWISTEVDEKTRTLQVRADVVNDKGCLLAHMFGRARIAVRVSDKAVVVPSSAVQWLGDGNVVFVRANSEVFQTRNVLVGVNADGFTEVLSGVSMGEEVATDGSYVLAAQLNRGKLGAGCTDD